MIDATADRALYESDRPAWIAAAAPRAARAIATYGDDTARTFWPLIGQDYKAAIWRLLDRPARMALRKALDGAKAAEFPPDQVPA